MEPQLTRLVEAARDLLKVYGYFVDNLWHVKDVHFISEQNALPKIGDDEAMEVFLIANNQFDGETGVSWPQLEKALNTYMKRKEVLSNMCESDS